MITLRGVTKRFGTQVVLDGLDLDLADGVVTAVMGPNGSGKTTLARLLLGLTAPDDGTITGVDVRRGAMTFQEDRLCEQLTAVGNVRLVLDHATHSVAAVADELRLVGLDPDALAKPVRDLSGGQRRRVAIVRAVLPAADLVVLDEPFKGLDTDAKGQLMDYVRKRCAGRTVLLITHDAAEAEWLDARVVNLPGTPAASDGDDAAEHAP